MHVPRTHVTIFSAEETTDVGQEMGSPVVDNVAGPSTVFASTIEGFRIDIGYDDHCHVILAEELLRVAMS